MASTNCKSPPIWTEEKSYDIWKSEIDLWLVVTDLQKPKRAPAIVLSLQGRKRDVAREIPLAELNHENGVATLLAKLKDYFAKNCVDSEFEAYDKFHELTRGADQKMLDYLLAIETAYQRIERLEISLPEAVQACKLLHGANLQVNERQMVLAATSTLSTTAMKSSLKRVFFVTLSQTAKTEVKDVKHEPILKTVEINSQDDEHESSEQTAFYGNKAKKFKRAFHRGRGSNSRGKYQRSKFRPKSS